MMTTPICPCCGGMRTCTTVADDGRLMVVCAGCDAVFTVAMADPVAGGCAVVRAALWEQSTKTERGAACTCSTRDAT